MGSIQALYIIGTMGDGDVFFVTKIIDNLQMKRHKIFAQLASYLLKTESQWSLCTISRVLMEFMEEPPGYLRLQLNHCRWGIFMRLAYGYI